MGLAFLLLFATAMLPPAALAQQTAGARQTANARSGRPSLRAGPLMERLRLDGRLEEPEWDAIDSIADLVQVEPHEGEAPAGRTVVKVLATSEVLVIGVRADDPNPAAVVSFARARDASLNTEDHVTIVIDTYLDSRSGYVFAVNPNGARYDALVAAQGEHGENENWDGIWEAATARTPVGWSAEIRIPIKTLAFRRGLTSWGFNVERRVQRLQETDRWASPTVDAKINQMSRAGLLTDLPPFDVGIGLSVRPAFTGGAGRAGPAAATATQAEVSLDVTQRVAANTLASLTINTDFGETEVDTRRTNLTRFPLFFPEKRTFFLEGSDIFEFGLALGEGLLPFHSRRIGLLSGREVPLHAGIKLSGREGGSNFGALIARTGDLDTLPTANTLAVARLKQNVLRESSAGVIATFGDPLDVGHSWMAGSDLTYQSSRLWGDKNLGVGVWGLVLNRDGLDGARHAFGGRVEYPNDLWDLSFSYRWLDEGFLPSLGFVPRPGVQSLGLSVDHSPRPRRPILGLHVRQMFYEFRASLVTDLDGRWESYRIFMAPINWRLESGDRFEFNVVPTGERLTAPFPITPDVVIPPGSYHWNRYRLEASLAAKRRVSGQLTWWFGRFYTGTLHQIDLTAAWKPSAVVIVELSAERNVGRLVQGNFTQDLVGTRLQVNLSPDLQLNSFLQYDNESDTFGSNTRLRWTFHPLGELFAVYNHNLADSPAGWGFESNQLLLKLQYSLRY